MIKKAKTLKIVSYVLGILLLVSLFKNISYPLLWADESMTAMGAERVVKYGYPKVHDGKNVLNDMYCSTPKAAVNKQDDAFIGGANWGQYYFGAIGYLLANNSTNVYAKTGIFRSTFAIIGCLGLFLLAFVISKFFDDSFYKYLFISLFLLAELISISVTLHLREVRYYSPTLFFSSLVISLYVLQRFHKPFNLFLYSVCLTLLLWIVFTMFSPLYFIFALAIAISETVLCAFSFMNARNLKASLLASLPSIVALALSYLCVYPLLRYFKTFEMKALLDSFYHYDSAMYWWHFSAALRYFSKLELLWLAVALRISIGLNYKKVFNENPKLLRVTNFLTVLFIVFLFSIPNIDSPMFTRYLIYMQPVVVVIAMGDFISLFKIFTAGTKNYMNLKTSWPVLIFATFFSFTFANNFKFIAGHIYEMTNQYKGPLDYTIPYIKANYPHPEDLTIATNYEETSYMYYLKSKVIVGFVGNNIPEDTAFQPDIISYRQSLGSNFDGIFNLYLKRANYTRMSFPARDIPVNNIPELNFDMPAYNHYFQSQATDDEPKKVALLIKLK